MAGIAIAMRRTVTALAGVAIALCPNRVRIAVAAVAAAPAPLAFGGVRGIEERHHFVVHRFGLARKADDERRSECRLRFVTPNAVDQLEELLAAPPSLHAT